MSHYGSDLQVWEEAAGNVAVGFTFICSVFVNWLVIVAYVVIELGRRTMNKIGRSLQ